MSDDAHEPTARPPSAAAAAVKLVAYLSAGVIGVSVAACVFIAANRSLGLTEITVTALDSDEEPRDHRIPFFKQNDALPDYELRCLMKRGLDLDLGVRPDTSAADGLTWRLNEPVSILDVELVRLRDKGRLKSNVVAEVIPGTDSVTRENYRFDFVTARAFSVGVKSFFATPVGVAITWGFGTAVLLLILAPFAQLFL
ncbi:MAG: hypothetical protein AAF532_17165 [Planctomycetota bacterium]